MSHLKQIAAISALVALMAVMAACTSSSEAEESSDRFAVVQDGKSSSAGTPATRTPKERSEPDPSEMLLRLAAIPPAQRTVGQDYVLATLLTADGKRHQAFEALASAVSKGFSDVDKLENDKGLYSLHSDAKWAQVLLFTQDNKVSGRKISPPRASSGPRARPQLRPRQRPRLNVPSPDWTMTDINGDLVHLSDLRGNIVVLDFWATWCGPCKMIAPILEEIAAEKSDVLKVAKLDVGSNDQTARKYNIQSVPSLLFFKNGEVVDQFVGTLTKAQLEAKLAPILS